MNTKTARAGHRNPAKEAPAEYIPDDVYALEKVVYFPINHMRSQKSLLRSFFKKIRA